MLGSDFSTVKVFDLDDEDCMTGPELLVGICFFFFTLKYAVMILLWRTIEPAVMA